jgi:catechol 2,3-dioxygenase-like lactoylglutathione lyase family enzyme
MKGKLIIAFTFIGVFLVGFYVNANYVKPSSNTHKTVEIKKDEMNPEAGMNLGAFSVSMNVKDLATSIEFYEKLGFAQFGGGVEMNYVIMKHGTTLIGLFQGMFEGNILTFNPGWDENAQNLENFTDVREIQSKLNEMGIETGAEIDPSTSGPASIILTDPDGNTIFVDQHR